MEENSVMDIELTPEMFEKLDDSKKNSEKISYESKTYLADAWNRFKANKLALVGLCFLAIMAIACILVPMFSQYTYDGQDMANTFAKPSAEHFSAASISLLIGVTYGAIAGYFGGKIDMVMMRIVDALYSIPDMLYLIMITVVLGSNFQSIIIGICISSWMGMARQVRAQVMTLKEQEFSLAAFVLGASKPRILLKHLIINSMGPIIVSFSMLVPSSIFYEATLGFLGIGLSAPQASWGTLANDARAMISSQPLQVVWPVLAICLTMLALNFIGDGLGDALDPKKK